MALDPILDSDWENEIGSKRIRIWIHIVGATGTYSMYVAQFGESGGYTKPVKELVMMKHASFWTLDELETPVAELETPAAIELVSR